MTFSFLEYPKKYIYSVHDRRWIYSVRKPLRRRSSDIININFKFIATNFKNKVSDPVHMIWRILKNNTITLNRSTVLMQVPILYTYRLMLNVIKIMGKKYLRLSHKNSILNYNSILQYEHIKYIRYYFIFSRWWSFL